MKNTTLLILLSLFITSCGEKIREEVTERFDNGKMKTKMKFIGKGSEEQMFEKLVHSQSGDTIHWENYLNEIKNGLWKSSDSSGTFLDGEKDVSGLTFMKMDR